MKRHHRNIALLCITFVLCIALLGGCSTIIDMATPTAPVKETPEQSTEPAPFERVGNIINIDEQQVVISYGAFEESFNNVQNADTFKVGDTVALIECEGGYTMETYTIGSTQ